MTCHEALKEFVDGTLNMYPALLMKANAKDETILHIAVRYGHTEIVKIIIKYVNEATPGEDEIKKTLVRATNDKKDTALHEAVRYNHKEIVELLINEDPNHPYFENNDGETPLYIAAQRSYYKVIHTILEKSNSPNHKGPNGRTALHAAIIHLEKLGRKKLLQKILSVVKEADENGWVPLHLATLDERDDNVLTKVLLEQDRNTAYMRDNKGRTALHFAAYCGNGTVMRKIIKYCPDCSELVDHKGRNALYYATSLEGDKLSGRSMAANIIVKEQQLRNVHNEKDNEGNTPLHLLARYASTWKEYHSHPLLKENSRIDTMNIFLRELQHGIRARFGGRVINKNVKKKKQQKRHDPAVIETQKQEKKEQEEDDESKIQGRVRQTLLVVATLIATVTFAAGFTLPGGTIQDVKNKGSPMLMHNATFKAFVVTDSLSFVLSASAVFLQIFSSFVERNEFFSVSNRNSFLAALLDNVGNGILNSSICDSHIHCLGSFQRRCYCHSSYCIVFLHHLSLLFGLQE
ncbi:ankyrin repeat-containing protein NPR4-like [Prosopis cineraria]|uniref:ankyrin repeat-containing protein NPR4-like n=1 Tax=Prosopis cineraria TaxID=364024 RepID=UPI00240EF45D|nr:ankyrin repeat-containing protein NPR4-like [Prosopis cineraria]